MNYLIGTGAINIFTLGGDQRIEACGGEGIKKHGPIMGLMLSGVKESADLFVGTAYFSLFALLQSKVPELRECGCYRRLAGTVQSRRHKVVVRPFLTR